MARSAGWMSVKECVVFKMIDFTEDELADLKRLETLSDREKVIFDQVMLGHPNKVIAIDLNCSQRTIEIHRANIFEKIMRGRKPGFGRHTSYAMARYLPLLTKVKLCGNPK